MAKCGACGKFVAVAEGVKCSKCTTIYDRLCVGLPGTGRINIAWVCPICTSKLPRDNNADTPVKGIAVKSTVADEKLSEPHSDTHSSEAAFSLALEMKLLREELAEFRKEMAKLQTGITSCENRLDKLELRVVQIESEKNEVVDHAQTSQLMATVEKLQSELNDRDQDLLQNDVEVANIPEEIGENPVHLVTLVAAKLVTLSEKDIVCAVRMGPRRMANEHNTGDDSMRRPRPRTLVVRLTRRTLRDEFIRCARVRRGATISGLGLKEEKRFYVNERLTRQNRQLFRKARDEGLQHHWKFVWTRDGRIYARQDQGKPAHRIRTDSNLDNIFRKPMVCT